MSKPISCPECQRPFRFYRWRHRCERCERILCGSCSLDVDLPEWVWPTREKKLCGPCHEEEAAPLKRRYEDAGEKRIEIIAYIGPYQDAPGVDPDTRLPMESGYHSAKDDAVKELQIMAAFHGREIVEELVFFEKKEKHAAGRPGEGPMPFGEESSSRWKATGVGSSLFPSRRT